MISVVIISRDEPSIGATLSDVTAQTEDLDEPTEILVVDASSGRLGYFRDKHADEVRWLDFEQPTGITVTIPHQRNAGVRESRGEIVVFTDAGCRPEPGWLAALVAPLRQGEDVASGLTLAVNGSSKLYDRRARQAVASRYLAEAATINLAFRRRAFDAVGGFDEGFSYGSDIDFSWRLKATGYRIRSVPNAVIRHDWGSARRQLRRSYVYGRARMRLYRKHRVRLMEIIRTEPIAIVYPAFLLGLPLTLIFPLYPALLLIPAWRNRADGSFSVLVDHLTYGVGILVELIIS